MVSDENLPYVNKTKHPKRGERKVSGQLPYMLAVRMIITHAQTQVCLVVSTRSRQRPSCKSVSFALYICGHTVSCWQLQNLTNPVFFFSMKAQSH